MFSVVSSYVLLCLRERKHVYVTRYTAFQIVQSGMLLIAANSDAPVKHRKSVYRQHFHIGNQ